MGLLRAAQESVSTILADQWREYFYCDSLDSDVLVVKGQIRAKEGSNKRTDNIISNGSVIAVNEGQCMLIVAQGKVVDFCAEAGQFIYDASTEPSLFYGKLGENIKNTFTTMVDRFTFGGNAPKDQRVYFVNTKEVMKNFFGTPSTVPFRVVDNNIGLDVDINVRCNGEYTFKIENPLLFYTNVCSNVTESYQTESIRSIMKSELITALQPAFAKISEMGIRYSAITGHTMELTEALNEVLSEKWLNLRGIRMVSMTVNSIKASDEDEKRIKDLQMTAVLRQTDMAAATLAGAQAEAMKSAASNTSAGAASAAAPAASTAGGAVLGWTCSCGKTDNRGKFCAECGKPKPAEAGWTCSCGHVNQGKFCQECGKPKPAGAPLYKCDKCGWEPEDPAHPPKFCPECGDVFDDNDKK